MDEDQAMINDVANECLDHLEEIMEDLLDLEETRNDETINNIMRILHSIKGNTSMVGFTQCSGFSHRIEDIFSLIREESLVVTPDVINVLLNSVDLLRLLLTEMKEIGVEKRDITDSLNALNRLVPEPPDVSPNSIISVDHNLAGLKILIAEDNFNNRLLLQTMLSEFGSVHIAVNGQETIDAFKASMSDDTPYDLICLDIMMPIKDGMEALKEIRQLEKQYGILPEKGVIIIMITALDCPKDVMAAFDQICNGYLVKPIIEQELIQLLKRTKLLSY